MPSENERDSKADPALYNLRIGMIGGSNLGNLYISLDDLNPTTEPNLRAIEHQNGTIKDGKIKVKLSELLNPAPANSSISEKLTDHQVLWKLRNAGQMGPLTVTITLESAEVPQKPITIDYFELYRSADPN